MGLVCTGYWEDDVDRRGGERRKASLLSANKMANHKYF